MNYRILRLLFLGTMSCNLLGQASMLKAANQLNWVEVSHNRLSTQIMFDFAHPVTCSPEIIKDSQQLLFSFPGMDLKNFNAAQVTAKLTQLQTDGLLKTFAISEKNNKQGSLNLALEFPSHREITNAMTKTMEQITNKFLIKWSMLEKPNRLIIDIYLKENLDKLIKKDAILLYATNGTQQYDTVIPTLGSVPTKTSNQPAEKKVQRVIIDPGHGGSNTGAKGHQALVEKDITLDISKRVHAMLKKKGQRSLLIRSSDKEMTLLERVELAQQLRGDLFVSIHANSAGKMDSQANGLETFYLDGTSLLPSNYKTGFLFINHKKNPDLINDLNEHMKESLNQSKILAQHIQKSVIDTLAQQNITITNRGVKQEKFRVLLQPTPAALVEVGFLTNRKEAGELAKPSYRKILAQGICDGICSYLNAL